MNEPESSAEMRDALRTRIKSLEAENKELNKIRFNLDGINTANKTLAWRLVDLFDENVRGVSPLHYVEEQIKKLQAENEARFQMQADRDAARAEVDSLRKQLSDQASELGEVRERLAAAERLLDRAWVAKQSFWYHDEVCIHHPFFGSGWVAQKNPLLIGIKGTTGSEALRTCQPHEFNGFGFDNPIDAYLAAVAAGWLPREGE